MPVRVPIRNKRTATTLNPPISPINVQPGIMVFVPVGASQVLDGKGQIYTGWTVRTDSPTIATAVKVAGGINVTGGTVEGTTNLVLD